jgi:salicylate hydroxylase
MTISQQRPLRIAIIGAGIGGLTLAISLTRLLDNPQAVEVDIYEQKDEISEVGTGIVMYDRTWKILQKIGVDKELQKHLDVLQDDTPRIAWKHKIAENLDECIDIYDYYREGGMPSFHRSTVQQALLKDISPTFRFHLKRRFLSYNETEDNVVLNFADGATAECDLLVGADGLRSKIRKAYLTKHYSEKHESIRPTWTGSLTYRALVESKTLDDIFPGHESLKYPVKYCGHNKHIVVYHVGKGHLNLSIVASDPEKYGTTYDGEVVVHVPKQNVLSQFEGWAPEATALLQLLPDSCRQWPLQYLKTLEDFGSGRVVFFGDAAHPMTPHQGSGAGQAIEDAYILARLIEKSVRQNIPISRVTEVFSKVRPQVGNSVVNGSDESGRLTERDYRELNLSDPEVLQKVKDEFVEQFAKDYMWHTLYPIESYSEKSVDML